MVQVTFASEDDCIDVLIFESKKDTNNIRLVPNDEDSSKYFPSRWEDKWYERA